MSIDVAVTVAMVVATVVIITVATIIVAVPVSAFTVNAVTLVLVISPVAGVGGIGQHSMAGVVALV